MAPHAMTIRLEEDLAGDLATVVAVDGKSASDVIRRAVAGYVATRKADPAFRAALREHIARAGRLLRDEVA